MLYWKEYTEMAKAKTKENFKRIEIFIEGRN